jgi:1-acyl-sn-glycerol-3-phosphate acyltransferase
MSLRDPSPKRRALAFKVARAIVSPFLRLAYAFRPVHFDRIPESGGAVLVCNHVSFIDWVFVGVALERGPRFVMHHHHWKMPALRWFFELFDVIPIAPRKEDPARLEAAMNAIDEALAKGELVTIFPEGTMTPDGELSEFRPGIERIVAKRPVPVVPLALRGMWGSFFSRDGGEPMKKMPRRHARKVELACGAPIPPERASTNEIKSRILELRGEAR